MSAVRARAMPERVSARAGSPLAPIHHPMWSTLADMTLLTLRTEGANFSTIAVALRRPRIAVEQRWHRLRAVRDVAEKLKAAGLTSAPYPPAGAE